MIVLGGAGHSAVVKSYLTPRCRGRAPRICQRIINIAFGAIDRGEMVEGQRYIGMIFARRFFSDPKRALDKCLGLIALALRCVNQAQVAQILTNVRVIFTQCLFADRKRAFE